MGLKFHDSQVLIGLQGAGTISLKSKIMLYENVWCLGFAFCISKILIR
jgi:hypothetical protein